MNDLRLCLSTWMINYTGEDEDHWVLNSIEENAIEGNRR